ncbi:hypothetical protein K450DRAFT_274243 [Umbelopsis ramanniana AG]|uniref:Uncharacterized protein n=1 Tax=Umbelopsis ramanniana AG TaxID=1314678 RepID=A0AAD5E557_UMBRA|nr:uncharacterized protein K450DRAFT_274243 [Umbelopsis ramanniana AG]KAI8576927.1 hypothetical protein K450DRAFT_274243 [Umbelopsis ramanniana AG]
MECEQIPPYSENQDPDIWIQGIERQATLKKWSDRQKEIAFYSRVTDKVRDWLLLRDHSNWQELKNEFVIKYRTTHSITMPLEDLPRSHHSSFSDSFTLVDSNTSLDIGNTSTFSSNIRTFQSISLTAPSGFFMSQDYVNEQTTYIRQQWSLTRLYISQVIFVGIQFILLKYRMWKTSYYSNGFRSRNRNGDKMRAWDDLGQRILNSDMEITKQIFDTTSGFAWIKPSGKLKDVIREVIEMAISLEVYETAEARQVLRQISCCLNVISLCRLGYMVQSLKFSTSTVKMSDRINSERVMAIKHCVEEIVRSLCFTCHNQRHSSTFDAWFVDTSVVRLEQCQQIVHKLSVCRTILQLCKMQGPLQAYHKVLTQTIHNPNENWKLVSGYMATHTLTQVKILSLLHLSQFWEDDDQSNIMHTKVAFDSKYYIFTKPFEPDPMTKEQRSAMANAYGRAFLARIRVPHRHFHSQLKRAVLRSDTLIPICGLEVPILPNVSTIIYDQMVILAPSVDYRPWDQFSRIVERRGGFIVDVRFLHMTLCLLYLATVCLTMTLAITYNAYIRPNGIDPTSLTSLVSVVLTLILHGYISIAAKDMTWWEFFKGEKVVYEIDAKQLLKWGISLPGFIRYLRDDKELATRLLSSDQACYLGYKLEGATRIILPITNKVLLAAGYIVATECDYDTPNWQRKTSLITLPNQLGKLRKSWKASWSMDVDKIRYARPNTVKDVDIWHTQNRLIKRNETARYIDGGRAIINGAYPGAIQPRNSFF